MKKTLPFLLCLAAPLASAYEKSNFQVFVDAGYNKFALVNEANGRKEGSVHSDSPKLDNRWQDVRFSLMPEGEGVVCFRLGPGGEGDIPAYYEDIRVNGQPLGATEWKFYPPTQEGSWQGSVISGEAAPVCLKVYLSRGAYAYFKVKKGERVEISMRAKSGSFLDALNRRLEDVKKNIDDASRGGVPLRGKALEAGRNLAESLNRFGVLAESKLHVSVPPLPAEKVTLESLDAKTVEWINAFEAEKARTAGERLPCLYEDAGSRAELRKGIVSTIRLSADLQTACLLNSLFKS